MANTTTIIVSKEATATAIGENRRRNAKPVLCITTGEVFTSVKDAGEYYGIRPNHLSAHLNNHKYCVRCKGMKFCFVSETNTHYDEITSAMRNPMPVKVPVASTAKEASVLVASTVEHKKQHGWLRTYFINLFKKFYLALEA